MYLFRSIAEWRPRTPFFYGWLVLGTAAVGTYAATGITQIVLGGIQSLIFEDLGWKRSTIAFAVTAGTWTSGLLTPVVGRLADRHGPRLLMPVGALVLACSFFALAGVHAVWQFYAAYIIGRGIANPVLIGVVPRTVAVNFFRRRRNLALGLTSMARPVGGAINIQVISLIAVALSWRAAYQYMGFFMLAMALPLFFIMRRRPEDIGLRPDGDDTREEQAASRGAARPAAPGAREFNWKAGEAASTGAFWLILVAESLTVLVSGAVSFQVVPYLRDADLSQPVAATALSLSSLLGAVVNPGWGYLADRFSPRGLAAIACIISGITTLLFMAVEPAGGGFAMVVLWGLASGGLNVLGQMMLAQYYGRGSFGSITGIMGPFQTGALGLGPTLGALLFSLTNGYGSLFVFGVVAYGLAGVLVYSARRPRLPARALAEGFAADD